MYKFGKSSRARLDTCHPDIVAILEEAIKIYDFSVISGIRTTEEQQALYKKGVSQCDGVNKKSKHQGDGKVSWAVDIVPYKKGLNPFDTEELNIRRFYFLMGIVKATAIRLKTENRISHDIRFGIDWDGDHVFTDQSFHDCPHFELVK